MIFQHLVCFILLLTLSFTTQAANYAGFTVREYQPTQEQLTLYLKDKNGEPFKNFERLKTWLAAKKQQLIFAMNAGMYQTNFEPVGLLVLEGKPVGKLNLRDAQGNFYWKPNGVFFVNKTGAYIVESSAYSTLAQDS